MAAMPRVRRAARRARATMIQFALEMDLWQNLGAAWDRLWYASSRATAQEVAAILAILGGGAP
ncbi:MAG TPA: hypothetical protein VHF22_00285, partial [Planctomycetota bacterium]|nr:hypothetical protein [Planctomycetota bacterium]